MRQAYVVVYDICEPKRLRRVYRTMRAYGDHLQYSVFRCELSERERVELEAALHDLLHHGEDQVLIIPIGPPGGRYDTSIHAIGRPYKPFQRLIVVV